MLSARLMSASGQTGFVPVLYSGWMPGSSSASLIAGTYSEWSVASGMNGGIAVSGTYPKVYAADLSGGDAGVLYSLPVALASDDMWASFKIYDNFTEANTYIGVSVRHSASAQTFYGLWCDMVGWKLIKRIAGVDTELATGAVGMVSGDVYRIEAEGESVRVIRNTVQVGQVTDASIATGTVGMIARGFEATNSITDLRYGSLPIGNVRWQNSWTRNSDLDSIYSSGCLTGTPTYMTDSSYSSVSTHNVNHVHEFELNFTEVQYLSKIRINARTSLTGYCDWDDVDVYTKVSASDNWRQVGSNLDLSNFGVADWRAADLTPSYGQFVKIVVNSTLDSNNWLATYELEFWR